jgi:hypothetical protein
MMSRVGFFMPSSGLVLDLPRSLLDDPLDDRRRFLLRSLLIRFRANWENCSSNPLLPRGPLSLLLAWHEKLHQHIAFFGKQNQKVYRKNGRIFCTRRDISKNILDKKNQNFNYQKYKINNCIFLWI